MTALDYDASTGWMVSAADDGVVVVYRETDEVRASVAPHRIILSFSIDACGVSEAMWQAPPSTLVSPNSLPRHACVQQHVEVLHRLRSHSNRVVCAEILDHMLAMTASLDGKIVVFNLQTGATVLEVRHHHRPCHPLTTQLICSPTHPLPHSPLLLLNNHATCPIRCGRRTWSWPPVCARATSSSAS